MIFPRPAVPWFKIFESASQSMFQQRIIVRRVMTDVRALSFSPSGGCSNGGPMFEASVQNGVLPSKEWCSLRTRPLTSGRDAARKESCAFERSTA